MAVPFLAAAGGVNRPPPLGAPSGIPRRALAAYEAVDGWCEGLRWELVAAIGQVVSEHGSATGGVIHRVTGELLPWAFGPPLDGSDGTDPVPVRGYLGRWGLVGPWEQDIGPLQLRADAIQMWGVDGDRDGIVNPHDIDDAAATAANQLCGGVGGAIADERTAVLRIKDSLTFPDEVLTVTDGLAAATAVLGDAWLCPVAGPVSFTDTWGAPRSGGRRHEGVDMFATFGTPVVSPVAGLVEHRIDTLGGLAFHLWGDDGNYYYGAHLSRYGRSEGRVDAGVVVGYMGDTGNAVGTRPHLHFEVHPGRVRGGAAAPINPTSVVAIACPELRLGITLIGDD